MATRRTQASGTAKSHSHPQRTAARVRASWTGILGVLQVAGDQVQLTDQAAEHRGIELLEALIVPQRLLPAAPDRMPLPRLRGPTGSLGL
jgi:hypothetical protein